MRGESQFRIPECKESVETVWMQSDIPKFRSRDDCQHLWKDEGWRGPLDIARLRHLLAIHLQRLAGTVGVLWLSLDGDKVWPVMRSPRVFLLHGQARCGGQLGLIRSDGQDEWQRSTYWKDL